MTRHIMNLMRWEWFKLRKRWMPWIMLVVLLLLSQLMTVWLSYSVYQSDPDSGSYASFTLPQSIPFTLHEVYTNAIGIILVVILTASVMGAEYGWGTVRSVLSKGTGRWQYLASKVLLLWLLVGGALLIMVGVTAADSLIAQAMAGGAPEGASVSARWIDVPVAFGKVWFGLLPYIALTAFVTVLSSSMAAGMAASLVFYPVDAGVTYALLSKFESFEAVAVCLPWYNGCAWTLGPGSIEAGGRVIAYPSGLQAFLVLTVYILVLTGLAIWVFQRKDVATK
jgi:ABC-2 type transport system permease protein